MKLELSQSKVKPDVPKLAYDPGAMKLIIAASLIIIFSIGLMGSISYMIANNEVVKKLKTKDLLFIGESISSKINARINRAIETSLVLANDPQIIDWVSQGEKDPKMMKDIIKRLGTVAHDFDYSNTFLASATTHRYWTESGLMDHLSNMEPQDTWFYETISSQTKVSVVIDYNKSRKDNFVFVNTLMGDLSHPIAVIGVGISMEELTGDFLEYKYGEHSNLWLISDQGEIYLSDLLDHRGKNIAKFIPGEAKERVLFEIQTKPDTTHVFEYENHEGNLVDLISYPIQNTNWNILFQIDRSETSSLLKAIKLNTFIATLISLVSIVFIFYYISHYLANPFKRAIQMNQQLEMKVMERTKEVVKKNQALMDSLDYAKRIQESILPADVKLEEIFRDHFILWEPRDIVGGDFYWIKKWSNNQYLLAVGDCTGHGVPGALMTMVTISILNQLAESETNRDPAAILNKLNILMKQTLHQDLREGITDDGVDLGLCLVENRENITFAGAKTSLFITHGDQITIVNGNTKSVGYRKTALDYSFDNHVIRIATEAKLYLTTDGFLDQNGGEKNYSFGKKRFTDIIQRYHHLPLDEQKKHYIKELKEYMGNEGQRDDITLLGFIP